MWPSTTSLQNLQIPCKSRISLEVFLVSWYMLQALQNTQLIFKIRYLGLPQAKWQPNFLCFGGIHTRIRWASNDLRRSQRVWWCWDGPWPANVRQKLTTIPFPTILTDTEKSWEKRQHDTSLNRRTQDWPSWWQSPVGNVPCSSHGPGHPVSLSDAFSK